MRSISQVRSQKLSEGEGVSVHFSQLNQKDRVITLHGDALFLAVSPLQWESLIGKNNLTEIERKCIENVHYYRYPVIVCQLEGFPLNYVYRPKMLDKENFGHVAFVSTRDKRENPEGGRLCSAYINQLPLCKVESIPHEENLFLQNVKQELLSLPG